MKNSLVVIAICCLYIPAHAWEHEAARICTESKQVPFAIVRGIVHVESNGDPFVLNIRIGSVQRAYRFHHRSSAEVVLKEALKHTVRIDIGLMQIHWAIWREQYEVPPEALLDVATNLRIGCDILSRVLAEEGPLWQRIGRYHSRTPERNRRYAEKVLNAALRD